MRFFRGAKVSFHSDVKFLRAALKPAAPSITENGRLFDFLHAEDRTVKLARRRLAPLRRGDLNVIEMQNMRYHAA
jgi:hypothetical protein